MKVMTYNIQSGRNYPNDDILDLNYCAKVIEKYNPDIVGLNEVHNGGIYGNQVEILAEKLGYPYCYFANAVMLDTPYGNAFMSKYPIEKVETVTVPDPLVQDEDTYYETRCVLVAEISAEKTIKVLVTHLGLAESEKNNALNTICSLIEDNPKRTVLMGDFNMHPDNERFNEIRKKLVDTAIDTNENYFTSFFS